MKSTYFFLFSFFPIALFSQSIFKGDPVELNQKILLKTVPALQVVDRKGQSYTLSSYLSTNKKHKGKPFVIIIWGPNHGSISKKITEIENSGLSGVYNVATLFLSINKTPVAMANDLIKELKTEEVTNKWGTLLNLSANWQNTTQSIYITGFPYFVYTDANLNVLAVTTSVDGSTLKKSLDYIHAGKIKGNKRWYTNEGALVAEDDPNAYYYEHLIQHGDQIDNSVGTKDLVLTRIQYLQKEGDYLLNGIMENKSIKGEILASGSFKNGRPTIPFKTFYEGGKIRSVYPVNGTYNVYHEHGQVAFEGPIVNGLGNGVFNEYGSAGKKTAQYYYKAGNQSGLQTQYLSDGTEREWFASEEYEYVGYLQEGLQTIKKNNLYGYMDRAGKIVIPVKYTSALSFENGKADVHDGNLLITIDKTGKTLAKSELAKNKSEVLEKEIEEILEKNPGVDWSKYDQISLASEGIRKVKQNGKFGFVTEKGKEITTFKYDEAQDFKEGMAAVKLHNKVGFINASGREVIPLKYLAANPFIRGTAKVAVFENNSSMYGFVDKTGKVIIPIIYQSCYRSGDNLVQVEKNNLTGLIDWNGKTVIPIMYESIGGFIEGRSSVKLNGKWGFIDRNNKQITPIKYTGVQDFSEGMAAVKFRDLQGTLGIWGYIDLTGNEIIKPENYLRVDNYKNGLARVLNGDNDKWGMIDKTGKIVIPFEYSTMRDKFIEELLVISIDKKYGVINRSNKIIIPLMYDYIGAFVDGMASVEVNKKFGYVNKAGELVIPIKYDAANDFKDSKAEVKINNHWFTIDAKGQAIN